MHSSSVLSCGVEYNIDLFEAQTIERLLEHWQVLLQGIVHNPHARLSELPVLSQAQRQQVLRLAQADRTLPVSAAWSLPGLFAAQVLRTPDALALDEAGSALSYAALDQRAQQLAQRLLVLGVCPADRVVLCASRSLDAAIALLAIFKVAAVLVPVDPATPQPRLAQMLQQVAPRLVLTRTCEALHLPWEPARVLALPLAWQPPTLSARLPVVEGAHLAYLLFTSGSTGQPKGVLVSHHAIVNRIVWGVHDVQVQVGERFAQVASWSFDIALWELFGPWMAGACVVLVPAAQLSETQALVRLLRREQISVLHLVPSLASIVLMQPEVRACRSLRCLLCGGERVPQALVSQVLEDLGVPLHQYYGPTEAAISVTGWQAHPQVWSRRMSLGRPISQTRVSVLDEQGDLVPVGVVGELGIGGVALAWGYWQQADLTAERFVPDAHSQEPGARLYRTGDRARWLLSGELEYVGRGDRQVKLRGQRVELEEIEAHLRGHAQVREAVVVAHEDESGQVQELWGYVVQAGGEAELDGVEVRQYLQQRVPEHLVPGRIMVLRELPLTRNGKIDREALPEPGAQEAQGEVGEQWRPSNELEGLLKQIWEELLGRAEVDREDNFFALGGHSLLAMRLMTRLQTVVQVEIPVATLFEAPTLAEFTAVVQQAMQEPRQGIRPPLLPVSREHALPLSFAQQRLWFLDQLEPGNVAYLVPHALRVRGALQVAAFIGSIAALIERHESLRTTFRVHEGQPVQHIHAVGQVVVRILDLHHLASGVREQVVQQLVRQETRQAMDLARGPLLRVALVRLAPQEQVLLVTMHHIISDGWSGSIFQRELSLLYTALAAGQPAPLAPLAIQYADFALWQRRWLQGAVLAEQLAYWKKQLVGARALELPTDRPRPQRMSAAGADVRFGLPPELTAQVQALSRQEGVTLFMLLLAGFQVLLARRSGQKDVVVGTDIASRTQSETEALIGFFVNVVALRTNLEGGIAFRSVLKQVRERVLGAYAHQEVPFEMIVEQMRLERKGNRTPLIQVLFVLQNGPQAHEQLSGVRFEAVEHAGHTAKFDLAVFVHEHRGQIQGGVVYSTDLFEEETIVQLMRQFEVVLGSIVRMPEASVDILDIYSEQEKKSKKIEEEEMQRKNTMDLRASKSKEVNLLAFDIQKKKRKH